MIPLPTDGNVVTFLAVQNKMQGLQTTHRLMHMAGSFGSPGSTTEGGQRYRQTADALAELNLRGALYAIQRGYVPADAFNLGDPPFGGQVEWVVEP